MTICVVDIGGTYIRLALSIDGRDFTRDPQKIKTEQFACIEEALSYFMLQEQWLPSTISHILIAKSGRNYWTLSESSVKEIFQNAKLIMVNDFAANAMGLLHVIPSDLLYLGGMKKQPDLHFSSAVIGSGTGLGLAYITPDKTIQRTHGGHMLPALISNEQRELFDDLQHLKTNKTAPIYEDALSGNGLLSIYKILSNRHHLDIEYHDTHHLLAEGRNNPLVQQSLKFYHEILGQFAHQVLAFGYSYGALYLTGGITDRIISHDLFDNDIFFKSLYQNNVTAVLNDVKETPVFWVKDEFISLKGLLHEVVTK